MGRKRKTIVFSSSRSPPPTNSIVEVGFRFWVSSKIRVGVRRGHTRFAFLIYVYPLDISWYIQDKVWHPEDPPHVFWKPKKHVGGYIRRGQVEYFSEISCLTPPKYSRVKGGGGCHYKRPTKSPNRKRRKSWGPRIVDLGVYLFAMAYSAVSARNIQEIFLGISFYWVKDNQINVWCWVFFDVYS